MSVELERWVEMYGDPEDWVKRAQGAHARAERAEAERDRYREALKRVAASVDGELRLGRMEIVRVVMDALGAPGGL